MRTKEILLVILLSLLFSFSMFGQSLSNFSTDLPLLVINTNGKNIPDEPKIMATMKIINNASGTNRLNDNANEYNGHIGIEIRGSSSKNYPQKPYAIETRNADGSNNNVSILGMPKENDWVLLSHYNDKSLMRNILGYRLFQALGNYAPRARLVDVVLNNEYLGIYLLAEKIKRDKNRVDIAKLKDDDNSGEELTGGYIFKIDYWNSQDSWLSPYSPINHPNYKIRFVYHDPDWDELTPQQKNYIEDYVTDFEGKLYSAGYNHPTNGYGNYIDVQSFIDYFIVSEISRNNDGFKKSRYFHKDKNGKITAGPVWDFDWAWKNINECYIFKATDGSGWSYKVNDCNPGVKSPGWMIRLFYDSEFKNRTSCSYYNARQNELSDEFIFGLIDSVYNEVKNAQQLHFQKWNILGKNVGAPEIGHQPNSYEGEVDKLKDWIETRLQWLDNNMIGECVATNIGKSSANGTLKIWPNPASDMLNINAQHPISQIKVIALNGSTVIHRQQHTQRVSLDVSTLPRGVYVLHAISDNGTTTAHKFIKK